MPSIDQFAVILFTLRDHLKTRDDALRTFDKVAKIGYKSVQISGMAKDILTEEEFVKELGARGLSICATHEKADEILNETDAVIERLKKLGTRYTAYPHPAGIELDDTAAVDAWIRQLDAAGKKMADAGLVLTYHNHHMEFLHSKGKTILDRIYDECDPAHVQGELDTYWVQRGGGCILSWIRKLDGRLPLLHLKDFRLTPEKEPDFAEIGSGNMDFPSIIQAAEAAGCQHYIVEQDSCPGDPFDSIAESFRYIRENLADS